MIKPMLAETGSLKDLHRTGFGAEWKFDGTRAILSKIDTRVDIWNRDGIPYTRRLPEIIEAAERIPGNFIIDGEAVYIDPATGLEEFAPCQRRCSTEDLGKVWYLRTKFPIVIQAFDALVVDGENIEEAIYTERKELLRGLIPPDNPSIKFVPTRFDLLEFFEEVRGRGMEGIMLKRLNSRYERERSYDWLKVKNWRKEIVDVVGWTQGQGKRAPYFGALVSMRDGMFRGCVGTGFDDVDLRRIMRHLKSCAEIQPPFRIDVPYTAVRTSLQIEVEYYKITKDGVMRHPSFEKVIYPSKLD